MSDTAVAFGLLLTLGVVPWFGCCGWVVYDWRRRQENRGTGEAKLVRVDHGCAGCLGQGSHRRWCATVVGPSASYLGVLSQDAEMLAEQIGTEEPEAAKACYLAALSRASDRAPPLHPCPTCTKPESCNPMLGR
jgi:hypothetical protein